MIARLAARGAAALATIAVCVAQDGFMHWLDQSCMVAGYVNVQQLRELPMTAEFLTGQDPASRFMNAIRDWTAVDLDSVTDVWLGVAGKDNAVFILQGTFNLTTIRARLGGVEAFRISTPAGAEFAVTMPDDKRPGKVNMAAFLTPELLAFGQPHQVEALLGNRIEGRKHPRAADLQRLDDPKHAVEVLLLQIPNDKGTTPAILIENVLLVHLTLDAGSDFVGRAAITPSVAGMAAPLARLLESAVEVYRLLPTKPAGIDRLRQTVLDNVEAGGADGAVIVSSKVPADMVRGILAQRLGRANRGR